MAQHAMMSGPDASGALVKCYRRRAANVAAGDWLPDYAAHATGAPVTDPDDGSVWVSLASGEDVRFTPRGKVWLFRRYDAPAWMADALSSYRDARHAWEALRESGAVVATSALAGGDGANVSCYQLEDDEYRAAFPPPRLADFIREAASARRDVAA